MGIVICGGCGIHLSGVQFVIMFHQDESQPPSRGKVALPRVENASGYYFQQVTEEVSAPPA
ncbi:MAG: hypothetical protein IT312_01230 [Anaerolineales bacterium]|nr:hypothetical protein [Anaerolineales bacterium]